MHQPGDAVLYDETLDGACVQDVAEGERAGSLDVVLRDLDCAGVHQGSVPHGCVVPSERTTFSLPYLARRSRASSTPI